MCQESRDEWIWKCGEAKGSNLISTLAKSNHAILFSHDTLSTMSGLEGGPRPRPSPILDTQWPKHVFLSPLTAIIGKSGSTRGGFSMEMRGMTGE